MIVNRDKMAQPSRAWLYFRGRTLTIGAVTLPYSSLSVSSICKANGQLDCLIQHRLAHRFRDLGPSEAAQQYQRWIQSTCSHGGKTGKVPETTHLSWLCVPPLLPPARDVAAPLAAGAFLAADLAGARAGAFAGALAFFTGTTSSSSDSSSSERASSNYTPTSADRTVRGGS